MYLKTETNYLTRTFSYSYDGVNYTTVDVLDNVYYLCDEGLKKGKRFTGAMIGCMHMAHLDRNIQMMQEIMEAIQYMENLISLIIKHYKGDRI